MYKKNKNQMLATLFSVPVCLLGVALQANKVQATTNDDVNKNIQKSVITKKTSVKSNRLVIKRKSPSSIKASKHFYLKASADTVNQSDVNKEQNNEQAKETTTENQNKNDNHNISTVNKEQLVKDTSSFAHVSVSATKSSQENPLGWNNVGYMLSFKVKNESSTGEAIPQGTKLSIKIEPDSRVSLDKFLVFSSINQSSDLFSLADNNNGTYDITINKDLVPGEYNFIVNFATRGANYDWDKPEGTNTTDPDPVPGKVSVTSDTLGTNTPIFTDTVYIKPAGYVDPGHPGHGAPGFATAGFNGQPEYNTDSEYHNESSPVYLSDGTTLRNPNDKSASGSMFFSYMVNYQAAIGGQAGAILGIKSKDKIDLQHYHLLIDKRITGGQIEDITTNPLLKWTVTDNEVTVDAGAYMTANNLGYPLYLRAYVPENSIEAINEATLQTGPSIFKNTSTFQYIGADSSTPYFRGGNVTIYDTDTFDAKTGLMAFEGTTSLTNKIIVTDYAGYPENGQNLRAGSYQIKYEVTGSENKKTNFSRTITVKHNQAEIKTKDTTIVAGPDSTWQVDNNIVSAKDEDGQNVGLSGLKITGTVNPQKIGDYKITYTYVDKNGKSLSTASATVHVVESKANIKAHDTEIFQGEDWDPQIAFDNCVDAQGNAVPYSEIKVSGEVNTNLEGKYPVKYSYKDSAGNVKEANVNVTVKHSQAEIKTKDTTIVAGPDSTWKAADNFISAKSVDGQNVDLSNIRVTGTANPQTVGDYQITYTYVDKNGKSLSTASATVHVVESKAEIQAHDTTIYVGDSWNPQAAFDKCLDAHGNAVPYSEIKVSGEVNTNLEGKYPVKYSYKDSAGNVKEANVNVTVKHNQAEIKTKDTTIVAGPDSTWKAADNFVGAKDEDGQNVDLSNIRVTGTANPQTVGDYQITYTYVDKNGKIRSTASAIVHVIKSKAKIQAHDTTIYVGDSWNPQAAFDKCIDAQGNAAPYSEIKVSGEVNTNKEGKYPVKYSYKDSAGNVIEANVFVNVVSRPEIVPDKAANVIVHFQDEEGNTIAPDKVLTGRVGDGYITYPIKIEGYSLKSINGKENGIFSLVSQSVTYIYKKDPETNIPVTGGSSENSKSKKSKQKVTKIHIVKKQEVKPVSQKAFPKAVKNSVNPKKIESNQNKLPQTGEEKKSKFALLIVGLATLFGSIAGALGFRKKES